MATTNSEITPSKIRFSNSWEDPTILFKALEITENKRILSVAGAGDSSFALLFKNPEIIVAFEENKAQFHLVELKKVAIEQLSREDCIEFFGFEECSVRLLIYQHLSQFLSSEAQLYWGEHLGIIDSGIIHAGKFEHYFQLFCNRILPFIHSKKVIRNLIEIKTIEYQQKFYDTVWNSRLWRLFFQLFLSRRMIESQLSNSDLLDETKISQLIFESTEAHLSSTLAQSNSMLHYMLFGEFDQYIPFYLEAEHFEKVKANCSKLILVQSDLKTTLNTYGKFDAFHLSEYLETLNEQKFEEASTLISSFSQPKARIVYWNLFSNRSLSSSSKKQFKLLEKMSETLKKEDNGFFYRSLIIEEMAQ